MPITRTLDKEILPTTLPYTLPKSALNVGKYALSSTAVIQSKAELSDSDFNIQTVYINNSHVPVTIGTRLGIFTTIEPSNNIKDDNVVIRVIYNLKGKTKKSLLSYLSSIKKIDVDELNYFMEALKCLDLDRLEYISLSLDYIISINDIKRGLDRSCYHTQTDTMLSLNTTTLSPAHPYSTDYKDVGDIGVTREFNLSKDFNLKIKYVNHDPKAQSKYINLLGMIIELPPTRLHSYTGVKIKNTISYITGGYIEAYYSSKFVPGSTDRNSLTCVKYTLEEAGDLFQIYDSYQKALENKNGNYDHSRKMEIADLQHQLELAKTQTVKNKLITEEEKYKYLAEIQLRQFDLDNLSLDISREKTILEKERQERDREEQVLRQSQREFEAMVLKLNNDKVLIELERKQREADMERDKKQLENQLKLEQLRIEQHYSNRSMARKDAMDIVKFVPGLIIGLGGIFTVYMKMKE